MDERVLTVLKIKEQRILLVKFP